MNWYLLVVVGVFGHTLEFKAGLKGIRLDHPKRYGKDRDTGFALVLTQDYWD